MRGIIEDDEQINCFKGSKTMFLLKDPLHGCAELISMGVTQVLLFRGEKRYILW